MLIQKTYGPLGPAGQKLADGRVFALAKDVRRAGEDDPAIVYHGHMVGQIERGRDIVADHHHGGARWIKTVSGN